PTREGELAEPAQKRTVLLTLAAAAVTLVVVLAVLAGPSVVECSATADLGACLRGKIDSLSASRTAPATVTAEQAVAEPAETVAEAEATVAEPAAAVGEG